MRAVQGAVTFALSFLFVSCGSLLLPPLEITAVSVGEGLVDAGSLRDVSITFSAPPTLQSLESAFSLSEDGSAMKGTLSVSGLSATFVPRAGFQANRKYELVLSTAAETADGNSLAHEFSRKFTTRSENVPPTVTSIDPANGTEISVQPDAITIVFSESIRDSSFRDAIRVSPSFDYVASFSVDFSSVSLMPAAPLTRGQRYTVTVDTALADMSGNTLTEDFVSSFLYGTDVTPPVCAAYADSGGSSIALSSSLNAGIPRNATLRLSFDEAVDSVQNYIAIEPPVSMTVKPDTEEKRSVTVTFKTRPSWNTRYTLSLKKGVKDLSGNAIGAVSSWPFVCDREEDRPPEVVKAYLDVNKGEASAASRYVALTAAGSFDSLTLPAEVYPADATVTSTLYVVVRASSLASSIPSSLAMRALELTATNSCVAIQLKKVTTALASDTIADDIRPLLASDPAFATGGGALFVVKVDLEIENSTNRGLVYFTVSTDLADDLGNAMGAAWEAIYNKG
jgi:hypothetical protein